MTVVEAMIIITYDVAISQPNRYRLNSEDVGVIVKYLNNDI